MILATLHAQHLNLCQPDPRLASKPSAASRKLPWKSLHNHKPFSPYEGVGHHKVWDRQHKANVVCILPPEPATKTEAMASYNAVLWMVAMHDKMASMHNNIFVLALQPPRCKPVAAQWLYKIKYKADSSIDHYNYTLGSQGLLPASWY